MTPSFFALFDDIALLMDDVASMTKVAAKKTAGETSYLIRGYVICSITMGTVYPVSCSCSRSMNKNISNSTTSMRISKCPR